MKPKKKILTQMMLLGKEDGQNRTRKLKISHNNEKISTIPIIRISRKVKIP